MTPEERAAAITRCWTTTINGVEVPTNRVTVTYRLSELRAAIAAAIRTELDEAAKVAGEAVCQCAAYQHLSSEGAHGQECPGYFAAAAIEALKEPRPAVLAAIFTGIAEGAKQRERE